MGTHVCSLCNLEEVDITLHRFCATCANQIIFKLQEWYPAEVEESINYFEKKKTQ
jgi:hypothetical protein